MKITRLLLVIVGFGALTLGPGFAGEPAPQPPPRAPAKSRPPILNKSAPALKGGIAARKIEQPRGQAVSSRALKPPAAPPINPAPRRGSGPASIGGPATSRAKNSAVIKGTEMRHKP